MKLDLVEKMRHSIEELKAFPTPKSVRKEFPNHTVLWYLLKYRRGERVIIIRLLDTRLDLAIKRVRDELELPRSWKLMATHFEPVCLRKDRTK